MPTPADLARIDAKLQIFFVKHGVILDRAFVIAGLVALMGYIGYVRAFIDPR